MAQQKDTLTATQPTSLNGESQNKKIVLNKETIYAVLDYFPKFGNRKFLDDDLNLQDQINDSLGKAKGISNSLAWGNFYSGDDTFDREDFTPALFALTDCIEDTLAIASLYWALKRHDGEIVIEADEEEYHD